MENNNESPKIKQLQLWSDGETRFLLDKYATYMSEIGPLKLLKNKKEMWAKISSELDTKTAKQCEERYKTVMKRKKAAVENNNMSGAKRQTILYEEELDQICKLDVSIEPEVQMSSQKTVRKSTYTENVEKPEKKKSKTVQQTLLEIAEKKEEARERRHQEKLEAVAKIHDLLSKIVAEKN